MSMPHQRPGSFGPMDGGRVVIEQTSKVYKKQLLVAVAIMFFGLLLLAISHLLGGIVLFIGLVWAIITKCVIWWEHG